MSTSGAHRLGAALYGTLVFVLASFSRGDAPDARAAFQYLYIDANEDQASGGHAAILSNEDVFHFQFDDGLLVMERTDWADFQLSYRGYQNRNIEATRLALTPETEALLREAFLTRHLTQSHQIERLRDARADVELLAALTQESPAAVLLPGFGFFEPAPAAESPLATDLRAAIIAAHGPDYIERQLKLTRDQLAHLEVRSLTIREGDFRPGVLPLPSYAFNRRYADLAAAAHALELLRDGAELNPELLDLSSFSPEAFRLLDEERVALQRASAELQQRLVKLASGRRPDWAAAFLLGYARLEVMGLSLTRGHWVFIDILDSDSDVVEAGPRDREALPGLQADAGGLWSLARADWLAQDGWQEGAYATLESRAVTWLELMRVEAGSDEWRIRDKHSIPRGMGTLSELSRPLMLASSADQLGVAMAHSLDLAEDYARQQLGYDVLYRNCVSELFGTFDIAMSEGLRERGKAVEPEAVQRETVLRMGGYFKYNPIPFMSSRQVRRYWRVESEQELPSLRRLYTADQYRKNPPIGVFLRESNVLTSSVYRRSDEDSFFIFFTDGNVAVRPLLGLVNLTSALGVSLVGAVQAPFDGGHTLSAGLRGALFSLPELGFQNIRKGTSTWIVPDLRDVASNPE